MYLYLGRYSPPEMGTFAVSAAIILHDLASNAFFSKGGEKSKKSEKLSLYTSLGGAGPNVKFFRVQFSGKQI